MIKSEKKPTRRRAEYNYESGEIKQETGDNLWDHWDVQFNNMSIVGPIREDQVTPIEGFDDSDLDPKLLENIKEVYSALSPLQRWTIPVLRSPERYNLVVQAQTGCGKTAAFLIPAIQLVIEQNAISKTGSPLVIVLCNTGNLTTQIYKHCCQFAGFNENRLESTTGCTVVQLRQGIAGSMYCNRDIVVASMGSLMNRISRGQLDTSALKLLIIDEADKMMSDSFSAVLQEFLDTIPEKTMESLQFAFFSATYETTEGCYLTPAVMENMVKDLSKLSTIVVPQIKGFIEQRIVAVDLSCIESSAERLFANPLGVKLAWLEQLIDKDLESQSTTKKGPFTSSMIIFVETRKMCNYLSAILTMKGYTFKPINSNFDSYYEQKVIKAMENHEIQGLIATNKLARGSDLPDVKHVVVFEMSTDFSSYSHRIGRTGRAGHGGMSTVIFTPHYDDKHLENLYDFMRSHGQIIPQWMHDRLPYCTPQPHVNPECFKDIKPIPCDDWNDPTEEE